MSIRFLPPSQRRHIRISDPIRIEINEEIYEAVDWSVSGFRLPEPLDGIAAGDTIECFVVFGLANSYFALDVTAKCVRNSQDAAFCFEDLPDEKSEALAYFANGLVTNEMVNVDGVMRRLERPLSSEVEPEIPQELTFKQSLFKNGARLFYGAVAAAALLFAGTAFYNNIVRIEVAEAVLVRPDIANAAHAPAAIGDRPFVRAYPTLKEAARVDINAEVTIYVPALDRNISGRIAEIIDFSANDPRLQFASVDGSAKPVDMPLSPLSWERVIAAIALDEPNGFAEAIEVEGTLPVVVYFRRNFW